MQKLRSFSEAGENKILDQETEIGAAAPGAAAKQEEENDGRCQN